MVTTRVVNIRDLPRDPWEWPADHVYIGRHMPHRDLVASRWANPYRIDDAMSREDAIAAYDALLHRTPHLLGRVGELQGKTLVCWCAPLPCHGDVLARLADEAPTGLSALRAAEAARVLGEQGEQP